MGADWAALDASIDGQRTITHDLGTWSDGVPVLAPTVIASDVPNPPGAPGATASAGVGQVQVDWTPPAQDGGRAVTG